MLILKDENTASLVVKKSRFIAIAKKCQNISDVKKMVEQTKQEHPDANHVVHAAVVGNQFSFSDDKEPKNTAGRPAFEVLKGSGISNICILIVRYFGGTLLGTGGLVKAYSDSAKLVLQNVQIEELVSKKDFSISTRYDLYESIKKLLSESSAEIISEKFETDITISGQVQETNFEELRTKLKDLSNGKISI